MSGTNMFPSSVIWMLGRHCRWLGWISLSLSLCLSFSLSLPPPPLSLTHRILMSFDQYHYHCHVTFTINLQGIHYLCARSSLVASLCSHAWLRSDADAESNMCGPLSHFDYWYIEYNFSLSCSSVWCRHLYGLLQRCCIATLQRQCFGLTRQNLEI